VHPDPTRTRKLLLHAPSSAKLIGKVRAQGYTLVPINSTIQGSHQGRYRFARARSSDKRAGGEGTRLAAGEAALYAAGLTASARGSALARIRSTPGMSPLPIRSPRRRRAPRRLPGAAAAHRRRRDARRRCAWPSRRRRLDHFTQRSLPTTGRLREISRDARCEQAIAIARHAGRRIAIAFAARYGNAELPGGPAAVASPMRASTPSSRPTWHARPDPRRAAGAVLHVFAAGLHHESRGRLPVREGVRRLCAAIPTSLPLERLRHLVEARLPSSELFGHAATGPCSRASARCRLGSPAPRSATGPARRRT